MKNLARIFPIVLFVGLILTFGCKKDKNDDTPDDTPTTQYATGWLGEDDPSKVPSSTNFGFGSTNLPSSYAIVDKFPPIGDQGQYGTCVAWAVAYNCKTTVNGIAKGYGASDLASASKQFSPRDLFTAIDDANKGENCGGTNFNFALDLVQNRGVATMATAPYTTNLGTCSQATLDPAWTQEAANYKFKFWRKIEPSIQAIKENISQNVPVVFGARLADNFMAHNTDEVITSATSYDNVGQHAYHAMIIAGYDDSKGPNGALRCVNSWGTTWGGNGYFWVDYNFFLNNFLSSLSNEQNLYIAANQDSNVEPPDDIDPNVTGVDLIPWVFDDYSTGYYNERLIDFNIYNAGNADALATADWSYYYIYYNAYDANDYGVIFWDQFNTSINENEVYCPEDYHCIINIPIPAGNDFAYYLWGDDWVQRYYYMPDITGYYYLLCLADAEDKFQEQDEMNNLFYTTLDPIYFENGVDWYKSTGKKAPAFKFKNDIPVTKENIRRSKYNTVVTEKFRNAYTPEEIISFFKKEKESGRLDKKIDAYVQRNAKLNQGPITR